jgi:phosphate transport system substrate-binding protein
MENSMQAKQQKIVRTFTSVLVLGAGFAISTATIAAEITGAGATFPYPIYSKWAE